jgi:hypothetical protein
MSGAGRVWPAGVLLAAVLAALPGGSPARAAAGPVDRAERPLTGTARLSPQAAALAADPRTALERYWTARRMAAATPVDDTVPAGTSRPGGRTAALGTLVVDGRPPAVPGPRALAPRADSTGTVWPHRHDWASTTNGRVFFDAEDGTPKVCSGVVVHTEARNTVLTAGHCVHDGRSGTWHVNWVFVPDYRDGDAPLGIWGARTLWALSGWIDGDDRGEDVGAAVMLPGDGGRRLADVTGSQGIRINGPDRPAVWHFGYPANPPFTGGELVTCSGPTTLRWVFWGELELACTAQAGASGGAWLADFDGESGHVVSVNSYHLGDDQAHVYGPHFGDGVYNLYQAVRHLE